MKNLTNKLLFLLLFMIITAPPVAANAAGKPTLRLAHTDWSSSVASAHLVQAVLQERFGYPVELQRMEVDQMWRAVADGQADVMLSAWLPLTHADYRQRYADRLTDLGPNLTGARIGLVVPDVSVGRQTGALGQRARPYIKAETIPELNTYGAEFRHRIIGIDPGAGVMQRTRVAIKEYELENYRLIIGSEVSMTAELSNAIQRQEWIVVTGWTPHWMFARWNLKFLEDPANVFGRAEEIHTMIRPGLGTELPEVFAFLDRFAWTPAEASRFMIWNQADHGLYPYETALRWLRTHPERVDQWLEGIR